METHKYREEAMRVLPHLIDCAQRKQTITYMELGKKMNVHHRGKLPQILVYIRDEICMPKGLPFITALVVRSSSGVPGVM